MSTYSPIEIIEIFAMAISQRDSSLAESCVLPENWTSEEYSAYSFFHQARRKKFGLYPQKENQLADRAAVSIVLFKNDKTRFGGYFLLQKKDSHWKIASIVQSEEHVRYYLQNRISAELRVDDLPSAPSAEEFLESLWQNLQEGEPLDKEDFSSTAWEVLRYFAQEILAHEATLQIERSHLLSELQRAGISLVIHREDWEKEYALTLWREDPSQSWRILELRRFLDIRGLLADPYTLALREPELSL